MLCSICLFLISVCPAMLYGQHVPLKQTWKNNTKNFLMGTATPYATIVLSVIGQPRISRVSANKELHAPGNAISRFLSPVLFRRVSPAETSGYAFARNSFALLSIIILVFRAITALQNTQNQIGTRLISNKCDWGLVAQDHNLRLLLAIPKHGGVTKPPVQVNVAKNEGREQVDCWLDNAFEDPRDCTSEDIEHIHPFSRTFSCPPAVSFKDYRNLASMLTYHIEVTASNVSSPLTDRDMPDLWLSNKNEIKLHPEDSNDIRKQKQCHNPFYGHTAQLYMPSWTLRPGYHVEAQAQLATRRFITSSFISDLIFNWEPEYSHVSLYPIVESGVSALPNNTQATATLRVTFKPAYVYSRDRKAFQDMDRASREPIRHEEWCTFIQDYREGNVFDVVGSIGGLFALLQAAHVFLFGRPMLWGLTGAKLLTPFGILGACSSRNFRRRLREQYHREPTEDNPETLRIGAFLRDFVIELGPADGTSEPGPPAGISSEVQGSSTPGKNAPDYQVPLLSLGLQKSSSFENSDGTSGASVSAMHIKSEDNV
ncbi:unnamed protein product [Rhizoctonia solani]|uniref:Uncharacterized protein n=1 Tax=Rhizoctonia solani TaxID=456999 RepID=A0A8H3BKS2_9AGAM|nr:unnamed protein product [Rhizoctonia solani]